MVVRILSGILILLIIAACNNKATQTKPAEAPRYGEMKTYWMVFLYRGPNRSQDSATAARIQAAHLANIDRLANEGKIIMAGPMGYDRDLRGIFIMDAKDSSEAASFVNTDPAVIAGRLRFEIHPWWAGKGTYIFK